MMREARAVAGALGIKLPEAMIERRLAAAMAMAEHKMSMLQDLERGRTLEIDALVTAVVELGRLTGVPTPTIEVVLERIAGRSGAGSRGGAAALDGRGATEETMPRPYSADLRERALAACERRDGSRAEIARRFSVAEATLYAWLGQAREEGRRAAKPARGGRPPLGGEEGRAALEGALADRRDATLAELADGVAARTGRRWSASALCRALKRLGWPRKKRRSGRPSRTAPTSARSGPPGARRSPPAASIPPSWSSSTRAASTPG
jgi:transposase